MRFWRIARGRHASDAATGEGARLYGGRWNSKGIRVVYASTSLALAAVETFVNIDPGLRPGDLVSVSGEIPQGLAVSRIDPDTLPAGWHQARNESLRKTGDDWIREGHTVAILVPSAAIRGEWNLLLNPAHVQFAKVVFQKPEPFEFDFRMFR